MYYFTDLALTLNEPEEGMAPTDSRRRPDQRLMEDGRWDEANSEKQRLEEKQRSVRREREREAAGQRTSSQSEEGECLVCVYFICTPLYRAWGGGDLGIKGYKRSSFSPPEAVDDDPLTDPFLKSKYSLIAALSCAPSCLSLLSRLFVFVVNTILSVFQARLTTATRLFGSSAARTRSQGSKSTSTRAAIGKPRSVAAGRAARTSIDLGIDRSVPRRD